MYRMYALLKSSIPINALRNPFRYLLAKKLLHKIPSVQLTLQWHFLFFQPYELWCNNISQNQDNQNEDSRILHFGYRIKDDILSKISHLTTLLCTNWTIVIQRLWLLHYHYLRNNCLLSVTPRFSNWQRRKQVKNPYFDIWTARFSIFSGFPMVH